MNAGKFAPRQPVMTRAVLEAFMAQAFPQVHVDGPIFTFGDPEPGAIALVFDPLERHLRPGGTISGPALFTLADYAAYGVILAHIGPVALAVTTHLSINFLNRPRPGRLTGHARLLKLGRRLAVVDIAITDADGLLVAQANATYSIPPADAGRT